MCLYSSTLIPKFTFKPIRVYKAVLLCGDDIHSPYYKFKLERQNKTNSIKQILYDIFIKIKDSIEIYLHKKLPYNYIMVGKGYFHAYTSLNLAQIKILDPNLAIIEAEIPKFSFYYISRNKYPSYGEICSNRLNIKNIFKLWRYNLHIGWQKFPTYALFNHVSFAYYNLSQPI